ncbi:MAG: primosomal protein N' [Oscillospiraceae bacterium]
MRSRRVLRVGETALLPCPGYSQIPLRQGGRLAGAGLRHPDGGNGLPCPGGNYRLTLLRRRFNQNALPGVSLVDMRQELRQGNYTSISRPLYEEIQKNLELGQQTILFLNRRGNSRQVICPGCGYVPQCPRCSVSLTYHSANRRMMCHYCGYSEQFEADCPQCGEAFRPVGSGTQKVEQELQELFPGVPILRMDADSVGVQHEKMLQKFDKEKIPILLGTQMVAKGLDFDNVTLVGVLAADQSLYVDNYHAAERTFVLLTQVVGRAGRGDKPGRALIQTYTPENEVLRDAARQDYEAFTDGRSGCGICVGNLPSRM